MILSGLLATASVWEVTIIPHFTKKVLIFYHRSSMTEATKPILTGLIVFVIAAILTQYLAYQRYLINKEAEEQNIGQETSAVKDRLKTALSYSFSATKTLAFLIEEYGVPSDFDRIAREIIESHKYIDALELTEGGVITHVYPREGNEQALGFNVLEDSIAASDAYKAIEKKELFFAGPLKLQQGGVGLVGRLPIFKDDRFWGFSVVLIKLNTLLRAASIDMLHNKNFAYQLSKVNPITQQEEFFLTNSGSFDTQRSISIEVPNGEWKLYVMAKRNKGLLDDILFSLLGIILSVTSGFFAWSLVKQPIKLNELVREKVAELTLAHNQSESIINSLPGVFYLYDREGRFVRWNKNFEHASGYSGEEISKMHPLDFFRGHEKNVVEEKIKTVFTKGEADVQAHFHTKNNERVPYYFNGRSANFNGVDYLIGMGIDITDRVKVENQMRERTAEIQKLTAHLEHVREEERTRIAREIHDELGQQLTGLKMDASWIDKKIPSETNQQIRERILNMISLIDETVKTVRRISSELRPGILDDLGLLPALEWACQEFEKRTGIKSECHSDQSDFNIERTLSTNVFRVYQEALTNVARHGHATLVQTSLTKEDGCIILSIKDNGVGFDMEEAKTKNSLGLIGMRERAILFNGDLKIQSEKGKGTLITLKVPLSERIKNLV
jgi:PAS domain S-box-containing protein